MDKGYEAGTIQREKIFLRGEAECTLRNKERGDKVKNTIRGVYIGLNELRCGNRRLFRSDYNL